MLKASDFKIGSVQAVIFTPNAAEFSQSHVLTHCLGRYGDRYNGPVTSLPLPDDAPPQVSRILLQSADNTWKLNAAPARIDSVWSPPSALGEPGELSSLIDQCCEVLAEYVRHNAVRVNRLALVLQRGQLADTPARVLVEQFCNEWARKSPFRRSENFEIHNHKRYRPPAIDRAINSWVRCRTGLVLNRPGVAVEQDLNTLEEEMGHSTLDADYIRRFFNDIGPEADSVLRLYFDEEGRR